MGSRRHSVDGLLDVHARNRRKAVQWRNSCEKHGLKGAEGELRPIESLATVHVGNDVSAQGPFLCTRGHDHRHSSATMSQSRNRATVSRIEAPLQTRPDPGAPIAGMANAPISTCDSRVVRTGPSRPTLLRRAGQCGCVPNQPERGEIVGEPTSPAVETVQGYQCPFENGRRRFEFRLHKRQAAPEASGPDCAARACSRDGHDVL